MKRKLIFVGFAVFITSVIGISGYLLFKHYGNPRSTVEKNRYQNSQQNQSEDSEPPANPESQFNKSLHSLEDPASLWVIVNKKRPLPANYVPGDLTTVNGQNISQKAAGELEKLISSAKNQGVSLKIISGYRSYQTQNNTYNRYVESSGQAAADTYSAKPGHSEHQTGLAVDLGNSNGSCDLEACFANTAGGKWLAANSYKHGFIVRYPEGKQNETGFIYEPWHLRFVGTELANEIFNKKDQTLEMFFGLEAAPNY